MDYIIQYHIHTYYSGAVQITAKIINKNTDRYLNQDFHRIVSEPSWMFRVIFKETIETRTHKAKAELEKDVINFIEEIKKEKELLSKLNQIINGG